MAAGSTLQAIRALSQYRPFEGGGDSVRDAHEDVVLAALAEAEGSCGSIDSCCETIRTLFRLDLSALAIAGALNNLVREGRVVSEGTGFRLTDTEARRLEEVARESNETAQEALADWQDSLLEHWPLTSDELDRLRSDLVVFIRTVLRRHGAEASMLLYPDSEYAQTLYADIEEEGFDFLEPLEDARLREIRDWALSEFIRHPTETQKAYLAHNLNTSYFLTVLSIDPEGARLVSEIASGQRVYLDTNFIYRLLGVQGPRYVRPAEAILRETHEAGYLTSITPWTLSEFRVLLRRSRNFVDKYPIPPDQYAQLAADATSDENFVTTYWRQVRSGVKPQDFFAYYEQVETHLTDRQITVENSGCTAVDQQTEAITDAMSLLAKASRGRYRHPALLEHDVKHRILIKRLRGDSNRNFSNAGFWFLTHDSVLPRYDYLAASHKGELPFCVSAGAWFQIVDAFRPKTEDLEQSLADMLASPYVRYRRTLSQKSAVQIVARVNQFKGGSPELATRVFMNSAALSEIETAETDEETTERIDNAIIAAAEEAQEDARRAREIAEQERLRADEASEEARNRAEAAERKAREAIEVADAAKADELERARQRQEEAVKMAEERADANETHGRSGTVKSSEHATTILREKRSARERRRGDLFSSADSLARSCCSSYSIWPSALIQRGPSLSRS
jgi:hypothetical protein